jgi:FMN reductase
MLYEDELSSPWRANVLNVIAVSGSPSVASRTRIVVEAAAERIAQEGGAKLHVIDLADLVPDLGIRSRTQASARVEAALRSIETADLLIVGSPVYKGSYSGLLKHLIDLIDYPSLLGTPVGLIATGGSDRHALVIEHQLRPLFSFFSAKTLPTGIFVNERAVAEGWASDTLLKSRFDQLVSEAVEALKAIERRRVVAG